MKLITVRVCGVCGQVQVVEIAVIAVSSVSAGLAVSFPLLWIRSKASLLIYNKTCKRVLFKKSSK